MNPTFQKIRERITSTRPDNFDMRPIRIGAFIESFVSFVREYFQGVVRVKAECGGGQYTGCCSEEGFAYILKLLVRHYNGDGLLVITFDIEDYKLYIKTNFPIDPLARKELHKDIFDAANQAGFTFDAAAQFFTFELELDYDDTYMVCKPTILIYRFMLIRVFFGSDFFKDNKVYIR